MRRCSWSKTCWLRWSIWRMRRVHGLRRRLSRSRARSARPRPRKRCYTCSLRRGGPMPRWRHSTIIGACHCRWRAARPERVRVDFFSGIEAFADAKAKIFEGVEPDGAVVLNHDNAQFARLSRQARKCGISRIVSFGANKRAEARLLDISLHATCSAVHANILGHEVTYKLGMPGRHMAMNSLAVLAASSLAGADLALASLSLSQLVPPVGRGVRQTLAVPGGEVILIDESYNANPASMAAALSVLGRAKIGPQGRRIAVLGDMLELGPTSAQLHAGLNDAIKADHIDLVFCCGPLMRNLWDGLSTGKRGGYADSAANLEPQVLAAIRSGDAVMIKGSFGSKMKTIVTALEKRFPGKAAFDEAAV